MTNLPPALNVRVPRRRAGSRHRPALLIVPLVAVAGLVASACGSSQSSPTTTGASSTTTGASASLRLESSTLPSVGSVLTGPNGRTLYYFTTDTSGATSCTGQCAAVWPPLVVPSGTDADPPVRGVGERVHGQPAGRDDPGHLPGAPALLLRGRHRSGNGQGPGGRRHLVRAQHVRFDARGYPDLDDEGGRGWRWRRLLAPGSTHGPSRGLRTPGRPGARRPGRSRVRTSPWRTGADRRGPGAPTCRPSRSPRRRWP